MSAGDNKRIIAEVFDGLSRADGRAFFEAMADDMVWMIEGQSRFSRRYEGKATIRNELTPALFANFASDYRNTADGKIVELREYMDTALAEARLVMGNAE